MSKVMMSIVHVVLEEVAGSSVLVSRSRTRFFVLVPVKELLGISPKIWVTARIRTGFM